MISLSAIPVIGGLFRSGAEAVETVAGVFTENNERGAQRTHDRSMTTQGQFAAEFGGQGWFNRFMDGVNRIPRPAMFLGVFGLIGYSAIDPIHFAEIMVALELVPDPLWAMAGLMATFFYGGRMQLASQQFKLTKDRVQTVVQNIREIRDLRADTPGIASDDAPEALLEIVAQTDNSAVAEWRDR